MHDEIKKIRFSGYKSFNLTVPCEFDFSKNVVLIIGRNNAGKSSVIDIVERVYKSELESTSLSGNPKIQLAFPVNESHREAVHADMSKLKGIKPQFWNLDKLDKMTVWLSLKWTISSFVHQLQKTSSFKALEVDNTIYDQFNLGLGSIENSYKNYSKYIVFRRINADRDIKPESETDSTAVSYDGVGATNLIRTILNDSNYDEQLVETTLLDALNGIIYPDAIFESVRIQEIGNDEESPQWEIFLQEKGLPRFALSSSGSGLRTIVLMLINLLLIPALPMYKEMSFVFAFEELENNLHPALQRRVFDYLYRYAVTHDTRIFLTSHSHVAINVFYGKEDAIIYHVTKTDGHSSFLPIESYFDKVNILDDLDVKASDLLQSNGIIWVEGPSDRVYIKRWLEVFTENAFQEGRDYQFLYYGGRLLSHYELSDNDSIDQLINVLVTNRNAAIVIDSDKRNRQARINTTKKRIQSEFNTANAFCWITKGKEIENYLSKTCINKTYSSNLKKGVGQYELFPVYIKRACANYSENKVREAKRIVPNITETDVVLDVKQQIQKLYRCIENWNVRY